jgi:membrane-associated phospholipid phosphatase
MDFLLWLQAAMPGAAWDTFWIAVSNLYAEDWLLVLAAALYWLADRSFARLFITLGALQGWLNVFLKGVLFAPRPEGAGLRVHAALLDTPYARPSAHAQGSAAIYSALAWRVRRPWFTTLAALAILLVGVSRLYLGLHWPADVLLGWLIGLAISAVSIALWPGAAGRLGVLPFAAQLALALLVPPLLLLAWEALPFVARTGVTYLYALLGALSGIWLGTLAEARYVGFDHRGTPAWQAAKVVLGLVLVLAVRYALKPLLDADGWPTYVRYVAVGATVSLAAPALFTWLAGRRLARPVQPAAT